MPIRFISGTSMTFELADTVRFPEMRQNVISAVRALSDKAYQMRVWIGRDYPGEGYFDDFAMNLSILYDDTLVLDDPVASLGTVLASRQEAAALAGLGSALDELLGREGTGRSDAEYVASPLWGAVVESAAVAYRIMMEAG
ncbi:hypothetical protein ABT404_24920 [Streptomyces hyaluromycini]|uniref:Uncharacterized protein n=1 Tax=Streptomyces hyaluromycini TaxID=1377993 RepID=A0ABV1X0Y9_9ACTN